ncbi:MAG: hypothetical protein ACJ75R_02235 [Solirubrobacterales bacterium]
MLRRRARHRNPDPARVAFAVLAAAAIAGCGGGDASSRSSSTGSAPITKAGFLAEADRICHFTNARVEAAADDLVEADRRPPPGKVRTVVLRIVVPTLRSEVDAIRALGSPAGDAAQVEAILEATERGIRQLAADPVAVLDRPPPALREAGRLARAYGSRECDLR